MALNFKVGFGYGEQPTNDFTSFGMYQSERTPILQETNVTILPVMKHGNYATVLNIPVYIRNVHLLKGNSLDSSSYVLYIFISITVT